MDHTIALSWLSPSVHILLDEMNTDIPTRPATFLRLTILALHDAVSILTQDIVHLNHRTTFLGLFHQRRHTTLILSQFRVQTA